MARGRQPTLEGIEKKLVLVNESVENASRRVREGNEMIQKLESQHTAIQEKLDSDPEFAEKYQERTKARATNAVSAAVAQGMSRDELLAILGTMDD